VVTPRYQMGVETGSLPLSEADDIATQSVIELGLEIPFGEGI
jgi:hypothetical protein